MYSSLTMLPLVFTFFLLASCHGPQSVLEPAGPFAQPVSNLWWAMFVYSLLVLLSVTGLWIYAWRRPEKHFSEARRRRDSIRWIVAGGLILPSVSIVLLLSFGIPAGYRLLALPLPDNKPLRIDVTAHQWWWEIRYPDTGKVTRNELHLPGGVPVDIHVTSADVIHSFWVPSLGGKIDAIPGRVLLRRLQADQPGRYRGQCAEFCGLQHAHMVLEVTVHEPRAFAHWLAANADKRDLPADREDRL